MKLYILVTHDDIDGITSAIIFKYVCEMLELEYKIFCVSVSQIDNVLNNIYYQYIDKNDVECLYIADISPKRNDVIDKLRKSSTTLKYFGIFDHHETSVEKLSKYDWFNFDENKCGSRIFFEHLKTQLNNSVDIDIFDKFVELVDIYDRYQVNNSLFEKASNINILFELFGEKNFIKRCKGKKYLNIDVTSSKENTIIKSIIDNNNRYINEKIDTMTISKWFYNGIYADVVCIFADQLANEIAEKLRKRFSNDFRSKFDCVAVIDLSKNKVSLRSINQNFDVGFMASKCSKDGGGHKLSSGFAIQDFAIKNSISDIFSYCTLNNEEIK